MNRVKNFVEQSMIEDRMGIMDKKKWYTSKFRRYRVRLYNGDRDKVFANERVCGECKQDKISKENFVSKHFWFYSQSLKGLIETCQSCQSCKSLMFGNFFIKSNVLAVYIQTLVWWAAGSLVAGTTMWLDALIFSIWISIWTNTSS